VRVAGRRGTDEFFAESIDISMTGLLIAVTPPHTFTADQTVTLDFVLPGQHERVATDARIVRDAGIAGRNHRYGVVFVEMSRQARSLIQSYVETQLY
jgi:c-di-GMP-binding flagellar brake protein YcgR